MRVRHLVRPKIFGAACTQSPVLSGSQAASFSRIPGIDGLRAIAILIVMLSHAGLGRYVPGGFGVTIFFFLSGYLITTLLRAEYERRGHVNLPTFYMRRALRILPPLYLTLMLVITLTWIGLIDRPLYPTGLALDALFLTNYAGALGITSNTPIPLWSLDVEEHFYLLFPALLVAISVWRANRIALLLGLICLIVLITRFVLFFLIGESEIYYWSHTRIDSIIFGAVLAVWKNPMMDKNPLQPKSMHITAALAVIVMTLVIRTPVFRETLRYSLQGLALFVLFTAAIQARGVLAQALDQRWLRTVALLSYSLYLVHLPMLAVTEPLGIASVPLGYLLAFGWAGTLYILVERPLARRRYRSFYKAVQGA